mmetsp:Transcript_14487/g.40309  ORF Transcript_14487/g.40309 Transcript_14487/m.40309 type:complete len:355 (-) Transcript_14487:671-1735(-)
MVHSYLCANHGGACLSLLFPPSEPICSNSNSNSSSDCFVSQLAVSMCEIRNHSVLHLLSVLVRVGRRSHGDQFLGRGRVDPDRLVEILLGRSHLDGNGDSLHHFSRSVGGNVTAHDLVGGGLDNDLHHGVHFRLGEGVGHWPEPGSKDGNVLEFFGGFLLRIADGSELGRRKDGRGHELVVDGPVHPPKDRVGQRVSLHEGHGCQGHAVGDVSHRVDAPDVGLRVLVDRNEGPVGDELRNCLQSNAFRLALAAGGVEDLFALYLIGILGSGDDGEGSVFVFDDLGRVGVEPNIDIGGPTHLLVNVLAHVAVESPEKEILSVHESDLGAESLHDLCKLTRNESTTHDHHPLGLLL